MCIQIEGRDVDTKNNLHDPVTYVPGHANGNANHKDCERGVIIRVQNASVFVLFSNSRTIQAVYPNDLVWG